MRLTLSLRIFLAWGVFVGVTGYFVLRLVADEIKPAVRQSTEEALVDSANLLAELLAGNFRDGHLDTDTLRDAFDRYRQRDPAATIWGVTKHSVNHQVYVTDASGRVLFDSEHGATGDDFSHWNDVLRTLRGEYGARTSVQPGDDDDATVMYVAAPVRVGGKLVGVVTLAKSNRSLQPYIDRARERLALMSAALIALGLALGGLLAWRFGRSLARLRHYAGEVSAGRRPQLPPSRSTELAALAKALESMRRELDGKQYVERYVQTLTHELKSPLAAIHGAAELLRQPMDAASRDRFLSNIDSETARLHQLTERLLLLAQVEQRAGLERRERVDLAPLVAEVATDRKILADARAITLVATVQQGTAVLGDRFLLGRALGNLLDNALDFTPDDGRIQVLVHEEAATVALAVVNTGPNVPDWALPRLGERFYSLPRPRSGRKSTGLGLAFVREVAALHGGELRIANTDDGVCASLRLPGITATRGR
ncbi:MAG: two-component system sensor histidine kinase CreC [Pseudomonadales bacterium]|nr:two-component system sensor histidine kinase CreC [Pseudomonadales bacterium]